VEQTRDKDDLDKGGRSEDSSWEDLESELKWFSSSLRAKNDKREIKDETVFVLFFNSLEKLSRVTALTKKADGEQELFWCMMQKLTY
jgi:hypothetical protein